MCSIANVQAQALCIFSPVLLSLLLYIKIPYLLHCTYCATKKIYRWVSEPSGRMRYAESSKAILTNHPHRERTGHLSDTSPPLGAFVKLAYYLTNEQQPSCTTNPFDQQQQRFRSPPHLPPHSMILPAVSYTHLDVYKRQGIFNQCFIGCDQQVFWTQIS